ncbi:MAG: glycosyltransferase family 39 protein [Acidobacteriota bacterium]
MGRRRWLSRREIPEPVPSIQQAGRVVPVGVLCLAAVVVIAAALRLWGLDQSGYGNLYYAAVVRSMLTGWHNFFYGSFDPAGFLGVNKPPVALWIQAGFARLCGFTGLSLLVPQALMGVASVVIVFHLARKAAGTAAGFVAGLALAVTPISVAVDRTNLLESCLTLVLVLGAWAVVRAVEGSGIKRLLLAAAVIGIGFNVKMMAAWVVAPAFALAYWLGAALGRRKRLLHLAAAAGVLAVTSLAWPLAVDLTPAQQRPWVGDSEDNSALSLAFGPNGIQRLLGGGPPGPSRAPAWAPPVPPPKPRGGRPPAPPGIAGRPGPLRLAEPELANQLTWLLPLAVFGLLAACFRERLQLPLSRLHQFLLVCCAWLGTYAAVLSVSSGIVHAYHFAVLAPPLALLTGVGLAALWTDLRRSDWRGFLLPAAILTTALWQLRVLWQSEGWPRRLWPILVASTVLGLAGWIGRRRVATGAALLGLLVLPTTWALSAALRPVHPGLPSADPRRLGAPPRPRPGPPPLLAFLQKHRQGETHLVAAPDIHLVAPIIVETGEAAMALGGFMGSDPILSAEQFAALVANRRVRFVLAPPAAYSIRPIREPEALPWVRKQCLPVESSLWRGATPLPSPLPGGPPRLIQLYDCHAALQ